MKDKTPTFLVSVYSQCENHERVRHEVPYDVYVYIKQLEAKIKWPKKSCLFDLYPELECESS